MNMPMNFGHKIEEKSNDVIPKDTILWAVVNVRELKYSQDTNGRYVDIELTIADNQPYARRKIWDKIADPFDTNNSEAWRTMGYGSIRRILEAVKGATPDNPNSYTLNQLQDLHGLTVPILVGIEKGSTQYPDDKNRAEYLSPHSTVKKIVEAYRLLCAGTHQYGKPAAPAAPQQGSMFTGTATAPPANFPPAQPQQAPAQGPGWLAPPAAAPAAAPPPQGGYAPQPAAPGNFPQPAPMSGQPAPANAGQQPQAMTNMAPPANPASPSPSNPGWPQQGGGTPAQFPGQNSGQ